MAKPVTTPIDSYCLTCRTCLSCTTGGPAHTLATGVADAVNYVVASWVDTYLRDCHDFMAVLEY